MPDLGHAIFLFVCALFVGGYGTLVGAGGGFLIVPMLLLVFNTTPQQAVGTSLAVVFLNAASGSFSYARQGRIDYRTGLRFALATVPGAILGAIIATWFTGAFFNKFFGGFLVLLAIFLTVRPHSSKMVSKKGSEEPKRWYTRRTLVDFSGQKYVYSFFEPGGIALSFFVGFLSSILGIGGGIIHVPALVYLFGFPAHIAVATSHFILAISALVGSGSHLALGHVLIPHAIIMGPGVIIGAQAGAAISRRIQGPWIVRLLSIALIAVGLRLLAGQIASG